MADDIAIRLRMTPHVCDSPCIRCKAADEIDALRKLCAEMAEAIHVYASMTRVPITTKPHYTAHALMALERWNDLDG